jgi:hypothetical protein
MGQRRALKPNPYLKGASEGEVKPLDSFTTREWPWECPSRALLSLSVKCELTMYWQCTMVNF